jgi:hypothetical protein
MISTHHIPAAALALRLNPSVRRRLVLPAIVLGLLAGCATTPPDAPIGKLDPRADLAGHRVEVTTVYEHEVKTDAGEQWQRVEYGWDYTDAVSYELTTDLDGNKLMFRHVPGQILRATEREQEVANDLVRRHPALAATAATPGAAFEGGFILMERDHPHCHLKSRCVYVLVSTDNGRNKIIQAIVDLQTEQVVDPNFDPSMLGSQQQL